jgi:hypothetical protein
MSQTEHEAQREVNALCTIEALRILAAPATWDHEDIRTFAQELCFNSYVSQRISIMSETELEKLMQKVEANVDPDAAKTVEQLFQEITAAAESAEVSFVSDFCRQMFSAELYQRANSKKASLYSIFQSAVEAVALFDDDYSPAEKLATLITRAEVFLFDSPDPARFKALIIYAFERSKFQEFSRLAEEIRKATAAEDLRRLAFRMIGPPKTVLDAAAKRLMNMRSRPTRERENPISRREVATALALRRKKPR